MLPWISTEGKLKNTTFPSTSGLGSETYVDCTVIKKVKEDMKATICVVLQVQAAVIPVNT